MKEIAFQCLNFFGLLTILYFALRKKVADAIQFRHNELKKLIEEAAVAKADAEKKLFEINQKLSRIDAETKSMVAQAEADALAFKNKLIEESKKNAEKILTDAKNIASLSVESQKAEIRKEAISRAMDLAEKTLKEKVSTEDRSRLVGDYIGKVL